MNAIAGLAATGVFAAAMPLGMLLARRIVQPLRDALALAAPLGVAILSLPLFAAAALGHFVPVANGVAGWAVAIVCTLLVARGERAAQRTGPRLVERPANLRAWIVPAMLVAAGVLYSLAVIETPIGSRDEGLYTLSALALVRAGTLVLSAPDAVAASSGLFAPFISGVAFHLPGIPAADVLRPQFSPLLPAWIAQLQASGGDAWLYRFNLVAALASGIVFYAIARRVARPAFATFALGVFLFNPAEVWIARINLSEPLGTLFTLAGLLIILDSLPSATKAPRRFAVLLFALATVVRVDMIVVAPMLTLAALTGFVFGMRRPIAQALLVASLEILLAQSVAIALLAWWSLPYVLDHLRLLLLAPAASVAGCVAYVLVRRVLDDGAAAAVIRRRIASGLVVLVTLLFLYAAAVRPYVSPFALIPDRGSALAGMRDYREEALPNLAAYIGWPCAILALAGVAFAIHRAGRRLPRPPLVIVTVLTVGAGLVYLGAPLVSPDHPWAVRRMLTLVIPLGVLMSAVGLQEIVRVALGRRDARIAYIGGTLVVAWLLIGQRATLAFSENRGVTAQLRSIDATLPAGALLIRGYEGFATTFALGFGREVLPLRDERVNVDEKSRSFWASCSTRPCTLLHANYEGLNGLVLSAQREIEIARAYVEPVVQPLARTKRTETVTMLATRVSGIDQRPPPTNAGAARDWRVPDRGFHRDELAVGGVARWTSGDALLQLPSRGNRRLELVVASAMREPQPVRVTLDDVAAFDGRIPPGETRWEFPLSPGASAHTISITSTTFVPGTSPSEDRRRLGVSVRGVRLVGSDAPMLGPDSPPGDFRSRTVLRSLAAGSSESRVSTISYRVDVDNESTAIWPTDANVPRQVSHVALGAFLTRNGSTGRLFERRIALPHALAPGEHWTTRLDIDLDVPDMRALERGDYALHVGLVLEGVAWFVDRGDADVMVPITMLRR